MIGTGRALLGVGAALFAACGGQSESSSAPDPVEAGVAGAQAAGGDTREAGTTSSGGSAGNGGSMKEGDGTTGGDGDAMMGADAMMGGGAGAVIDGGGVIDGSQRGAAGTASGAEGGTSADPRACQSVDDCVIATVFENSGCCARTDCGSAFNRDWVLSEPCASSDATKDPVPASCSAGCKLCPASQCAEPVGVTCTAGTCQTISVAGPCATDGDCVLAIDYTTVQGACCGCAEVVSKAFEAAESCVALEGAAKPAGCKLLSGGCAVDCAACSKPKPICNMGRCVSG